LTPVCLSQVGDGLRHERLRNTNNVFVSAMTQNAVERVFFGS